MSTHHGLSSETCREIKTQNFGALGISFYPIETSTLWYTDQCFSHFFFQFTIKGRQNFFPGSVCYSPMLKNIVHYASLEHENISSLSPGPHTMNPLMYRHERNPPENSSHFQYSMYGDHGVFNAICFINSARNTVIWSSTKGETSNECMNIHNFILYSRMSCCSSCNVGINICVYSAFSNIPPVRIHPFLYYSKQLHTGNRLS